MTVPTSLTDTNRIAVTHRGYTLYFRPDGASSSSAVSSAPETPAGANARMTAVHTESSVTYAGVYGGADIRYDLQSNSLKESYILQSLASTSEVYSSTIAAPGLTPKLHEDGSIDFTDENGEIIFYIPPSYLYDADGLIGNVAVELYTLNTGEYAMVCRPDHDWLADAERAWPVTLDPTIYTMLSTSSFEDCYVTTAGARYSYPYTNNLIVGNAGTSGTCRTFIRINDLPSIGSSDVIISAKLHYYCEFSSKVPARSRAASIRSPPPNGSTIRKSPGTISRHTMRPRSTSSSTTTGAWAITSSTSPARRAGGTPESSTTDL